MERAQKGGNKKEGKGGKSYGCKTGGSRSLKCRNIRQQKMKHRLLECLQRTSMRSLS